MTSIYRHDVIFQAENIYNDEDPDAPSNDTEA